MPTRGKCFSCGETGFLSLLVVTHKGDGHREAWMVCAACRKYYETEAKEAWTLP